MSSRPAGSSSGGSSGSGSSSSSTRTGRINTLDFDSNRRKPAPNDDALPDAISDASTPRDLLRDDVSLLGATAAGIVRRDRRRMRLQILRVLSYGSGILSAYACSLLAPLLRPSKACNEPC